ncbi:MAG: signal peptidase II [Bdellovibrionaceae bacterium]|nr:signal peptidase II [Pseudobdellovibrionaceae bacterium]|tara:strand:- start:219 stop:719 length:501 start_codon:yes stop_codon:yes gene_type:complete
MKTKYKLLLGISPLVVLIDQWTKLSVIEHFRVGESIEIITSYFNLTYVRNYGAAFGFMAGVDPSVRGPFFVFVPILALIMISYLFYKLESGQIRAAVSYSLILAGAVGNNLIDRMLYGYVVDFLDFHWKEVYHWPAFNVADIAIVVGVSLMFLDLFQNENASGKES